MKNNYENIKALYASVGVDTEAAINRLAKIKLSLQCWQGDDVKGFLFKDQALTGGISVTGNYPNAARNIDELRSDIAFALSLIPGNHKLNLHAIYLDTKEAVDLNQIEPKHYQSWVDFAKKQNIGLDFNPTCFAHPMSSSGFTLSSDDIAVKAFWVEHVKRSRKIGSYFSETLGQKSVVNLWIPDGYKDTPYDSVSPRKRLKLALDEIYSERLNVVDTLESKLFGIGTESYTVGSHEFYLSYALKSDLGICLDTGHFHPTESVADKIASISFTNIPLLLHVSRPVRWDSDHVVTFNDDMNHLAEVIIRANLDETIHIGFDYFDASINRVAAWVIGARAFQLSLLKAMLEPTEHLKAIEVSGDFTQRLYQQELFKSLPYGLVYEEFLRREGKPSQTDWFDILKAYEKKLERA